MQKVRLIWFNQKKKYGEVELSNGDYALITSKYLSKVKNQKKGSVFLAEISIGETAFDYLYVSKVKDGYEEKLS